MPLIRQKSLWHTSKEQRAGGSASPAGCTATASLGSAGGEGQEGQRGQGATAAITRLQRHWDKHIAKPHPPRLIQLNFLLNFLRSPAVPGTPRDGFSEWEITKRCPPLALPGAYRSHCECGPAPRGGWFKLLAPPPESSPEAFLCAHSCFCHLFLQPLIFSAS